MEKQRTRYIRIIKKEGEKQRGGKTLVVGSQRKVLAPWRWGDGMLPGSRTEEFVKPKG